MEKCMEKKFLNKIITSTNSLGQDQNYRLLISEYLWDYEVVKPLNWQSLPSWHKYSVQQEWNKKVLFLSRLESKIDVLELIYTVLLKENRNIIPEGHAFYKLVEWYIDEQIFLMRANKTISESEMKELFLLIESHISNMYPWLREILRNILYIKLKIGTILEPWTYVNNFYWIFNLYLLEVNMQDFNSKKNRSLNDYLRVWWINICVEWNEQEALDIFLEANYKYPNNSKILSSIAECYEFLWEDRCAVKYYELALNIDPNDTLIIKKYFSFHVSHMFSFDEETHKSNYNIILIRKFIKIFNNVIHNNLWDDECVEMFAKLNYFLFKNNTEKKEYLEISYKYYLLAHNLDKTNVIYLEMIIEISILLWKYDEFIQYCEEIISFYPWSYTTWYYLSEFYSKLNRNLILWEFCKSVSQWIVWNAIDNTLLYQAIQENDWDFVFQSYSRKREELVNSFIN